MVTSCCHGHYLMWTVSVMWKCCVFCCINERKKYWVSALTNLMFSQPLNMHKLAFLWHFTIGFSKHVFKGRKNRGFDRTFISLHPIEKELHHNLRWVSCNLAHQEKKWPQNYCVHYYFQIQKWRKKTPNPLSQILLRPIPIWRLQVYLPCHWSNIYKRTTSMR